MPKILFLLFIWALTVNVAIAQTTFSESRQYTPRELTKKQEKKIKREDRSDPLREEIIVPVSVKASSTGEYVTGIGAEEFEIFVGDERRDIIGFDASSATPRNIVFLIDDSPSTMTVAGVLSEILIDMINALGPRDRSVVAVFNQQVGIIQDFTSDKTLLKRAVKNFPLGNGTSVYDTISVFSRNTVKERIYVFLFTDGVDTTSRRSDFERSLLDVEKGNITYFPVYIDTSHYAPPTSANIHRTHLPFPISVPNMRLGASKKELEIGREYLVNLAEISGGRMNDFTTDPVGRNELVRSVIADIRSRYELRIKAPKPSDDIEHHPIKVRVARPNLTVSAPGSYITGY